MKFKALAFTLGMVATGMASGASAEPLKLEKSSAWVMDYAESNCRLWATFGEGEQKSTLEFAAPSQSSSGVDVLVYPSTLSDQGLKLSWTKIGEKADAKGVYQIKFATGTGEDGSGLLFGAGLGHDATGLLDDPSAEDFQPASEKEAAEKAVEGLFLTDGSGKEVAYMTGGLKAPLDALRSCTDNLLSGFGVDPVALRSRSRSAARSDWEEWRAKMISAYPTEALRNGEEGVVWFLAVINEKGRAEQCHVTRNLASETIAETTCKNLRRYGRFTPALDANGNPITGIYVSAMNYDLH